MNLDVQGICCSLYEGIIWSFFKHDWERTWKILVRMANKLSWNHC